MRLLLVRHGETDWNAAGRIQGATDTPLNARGREQALALAGKLRYERPARLCTSPLRRARERALAFLTLEVRRSNAAAIGLYEKFGFERFGVRPNAIHLKDGPRLWELLMVKTL